MSEQRTSFDDHERRTLDRFVCTKCGRPLELVEMRRTREEMKRAPLEIEFIAACRTCEIGMARSEWWKRKDAQT